ncbi:MAG: fasciclin domain-containing protein [Coleofasciculaceae cyanobacterium]
MADIIETAKNAGSFNTLLTALEAVDLVELLKSSGSYTVFAPIDDAFAKLPEGTLADLLKDLPKLKKILTYHVVFGDVRTDDLVELEEAETVEGSVIAIDTSNGYKVNEAVILTPDVIADNGVIHIIDSVLMPAMLEYQVKQ